MEHKKEGKPVLRVLHIITDKNIGGAGQHLLTLLQHYDRTRLHLEVLCPPDAALIPSCKALGVTTHTLPNLTDHSLARSFIDLFGARGGGLILAMRRLIRARNIDLVHTHAAFTGRLAARLAGVKAVVYTKHRLDGRYPRSGWKQKGLAWLNCRTSDRVIAVSQAVQAALIAEGIPEARIVLIYNGINLAAWQHAAELTTPPSGQRTAEPSLLRTELGLDQTPVVGIVARLEPEKGHVYFLEAAARVLHAHPHPVKFLVVGAGTLEAELKAQAAALGMHDQVIFTGFRPDVPALLSLMQVVVVPSLTEAFGLSLVEAMALAKPCVVSAVGGLKEIATHRETALFVPPAQSLALADQVLYLLQNPGAAAAIGARAAQSVEARFSGERMAAQLTDLYFTLIPRFF